MSALATPDLCMPWRRGGSRVLRVFRGVGSGRGPGQRWKPSCPSWSPTKQMKADCSVRRAGWARVRVLWVRPGVARWPPCTAPLEGGAICGCPSKWWMRWRGEREVSISSDLPSILTVLPQISAHMYSVGFFLVFLSLFCLLLLNQRKASELPPTEVGRTSKSSRCGRLHSQGRGEAGCREDTPRSLALLRACLLLSPGCPSESARIWNDVFMTTPTPVSKGFSLDPFCVTLLRLL